MPDISRDDAKKFGLWFLIDIVEWIEKNLEPYEIYSEDALSEWATENGFVKSEQN